MNSIKKSRMFVIMFSSIFMIGSGAQLSFASGSYAPPQARGVKSVQVELYHLGKRLTLKRVTPTQAKGVKEDRATQQQATLKSLAARIQKKHLKALDLSHLTLLVPQEFDAVVVYLTTRYGVASS